MTGYVELYMDQGSNFTNVINLVDDTTNANINVAGYTVRSQMRRSYYSANATANLVCTVTDGSNGEITMSLGSGNTTNIKAGRYLFDLETVNTSNVTARPLEGIITVNPNITR